MATMPRRAETATGMDKLLRAARVLELPALVTLQYVKGLGPVCSELTEAAAGWPTFEKMAFSCCGQPNFLPALKELRRPRVILAGIETHVCVQQTAIDLLAAQFAVYICADAVSSRRDLDREVALSRMHDCGAVITSVESVIFELLREAGTPAFKACLPLVK